MILYSNKYDFSKVKSQIYRTVVIIIFPTHGDCWFCSRFCDVYSCHTGHYAPQQIGICVNNCLRQLSDLLWLQVAFQQADYVAWNLWSSINARPLLPFKYQHLGDMMSLGAAPPPPQTAVCTMLSWSSVLLHVGFITLHACFHSCKEHLVPSLLCHVCADTCLAAQQA